MAYIEIPDSMVGEYKPVTSRLMRRWSRNISGLAGFPIRGFTLAGGTISATFTTVASFPLFIPECAIGSGGTIIQLDLDVQVFESGSGNTGTFRFGVGSDYSDEDTLTVPASAGSDTDTIFLTLTFDPGSEGVVTVNLQAKSSDGTNSAGLTLQNGYSTSSRFAGVRA